MFSQNPAKQKRFKGIDAQNKERESNKRADVTKNQLINALRGFYVQKLGKLNRHAAKGRVISVILLVLREWFSIQMHFTPKIQTYLSDFFQSSNFMDAFVWLEQVSESSSSKGVSISCLIANGVCVMYLWILAISAFSLKFDVFNYFGSGLIQIYEYALLIPFLFFATSPAQNFLNYLNIAPTALIGFLFSSVNYSIEIRSKDILARYDSLSNIIFIFFEIIIAVSYHKFSAILHLTICAILNIFKLLSSLRCHIYHDEQINSLFLGFQILKFLFSMCLLAAVISESIKNVLALILMLSIPFAWKLSTIIVTTYNQFIVCSQNINFLKQTDNLEHVLEQDNYLRHHQTQESENFYDTSGIFHESFLVSSLQFLLSYIASNATRNLEVFCRQLALHPSFLYAKQLKGEQTTFKLIQQLAQANAKSQGATLKQINIINEMGSERIIWERVQRVSDIESKHLLRRFIVGVFKTTLKQIKDPSKRANILCIYLMHLLTVQQNVFLAYTELVSFGQQNTDKTNWKTKQKIDWVMEILLEKSKTTKEISSNGITQQGSTTKSKEIESVQLYKILQFEIKVEELRNDFQNCVSQWRKTIGIISQSEIDLEAVESAVWKFRKMKSYLTKEIEALLESNNQSEELKILCVLVDSYLQPKVSMSSLFDSHRSHQGVLLKELREFYNESSCLVMISLLPHDFGIIKRVSRNFKRVFMLQSDTMIVGHHFKRFLAPSVCPDPTRIKQLTKNHNQVRQAAIVAKNQWNAKSNLSSEYHSQEALISARNYTNRPFLGSQTESANGFYQKDPKFQENLETNLDVQLTEYLHKYNQLVDVQQVIVAIDSRGYALPLKVKVQTQAVESSEFGVIAWMQPLQQQLSHHSPIYIVLNQNHMNSVETISESFLQFLPRQFDIQKDLKQYNICSSLPVILSLLDSETELEGDLTTLLVSIGNLAEISVDNSLINDILLRKKELYTVNLTIKKVNNDFQAYTYVIINSKKKITRSLQKLKLIASMKMQLQEAAVKQQEMLFLAEKFREIEKEQQNYSNQQRNTNITDATPKNSSFSHLENAFDFPEKARAKSRTHFKKLTLLFQQNLSDGISINSPHMGSQMSISQEGILSSTVPLTFRGSQLKSIFAKEREANEGTSSAQENNSKNKLKINLISNTDMLLNSLGEANTNEGMTTSVQAGLNYANTIDRMLEPMTFSIATTFQKIKNDTTTISQLPNILSLDKPIRQRSSSQPLTSARDNPLIFLSSEDPMNNDKQPDRLLHSILKYPAEISYDGVLPPEHKLAKPQLQLKVQQNVGLNEKVFAKIDTWNTNNMKDNNNNFFNSTVRQNSKNSFEDIADEEEEEDDHEEEEDNDDEDVDDNKNSWRNSKQSHGKRSSINTTYENKRTINSLHEKTQVSEIKAINIAGILLICIITILTIEGFLRSYSSLTLQEKNFQKINWMYLINIHVSQAFSEYNIKLQNDNGLFKQTGVVLNQNFTNLINSLLLSRVTLSYELLNSVSNSTDNNDIQVFNIIENSFINEILYSSYESFTASPSIISSMDLTVSMLYSLQQQAASIYHFVNNRDTLGFLRYQSEKNYPTINMRLQTVVSSLNGSYQSQLDGLRSDSLVQFIIVLLFSFLFLAAILPMSVFVHRLHNNILQLFTTINLDYLKDELKILTYFLTFKDNETNHKSKQLLLKTLRTIPDQNNLSASRRRMSVMHSPQAVFKLTNTIENVNITKKGNIATAVLIPYNYKPLTLALLVIFILIMIYPSANYYLISSFIDNSRHVYKFNNAFCEAYFLLINCLRARQGLAVSTLLPTLSSQQPTVYRKLFQDLIPQIPTVMANFNDVMSDHQKLSLYHKASVDSFIIALLEQHACNVVTSNLSYSNGDFDYYLCISAAKGILTKGFLNGIGYFYSVFVDNSYFAQLLDPAAYLVQYNLFNTRINGYNQLKFKGELTKIIDYSLNFFQIYNKQLYDYYKKLFAILFGIQVTFLILLYGIAWRSYYAKINLVAFNAKQLLDVFPKSQILKNNYIVSFLKRKK